MNIQEAKDEIKRTLRIYTQKSESGQYRIPIEKQRPILLIGPPGIGKTAIMKQIAAEMQTGLVSYTMTHHTRQSAIGLPYITSRSFHNMPVSITEYTMSEIVASIHIYMEETGLENGILFLDEINCVSETLAPVMLQLLQNKTFGNHPLPPGWLIAAAGNPPEYNKSVREMDMVTLDRVKHMEIEADLAIWQQYASINRVHPAIRSYLSVYPDHFYCIEGDTRGRRFVTARGWEDLSVMLSAYEDSGEPVKESFLIQYLQHDAIAHSFYMFYRYFREAMPLQASDGPSAFLLPDSLHSLSAAEVLAMTSLLFDQLKNAASQWAHDRDLAHRIRQELTILGKSEISSQWIAKRREVIAIQRANEAISLEEEFIQEDVLRELEELALAEKKTDDSSRLREECMQNGLQSLAVQAESLTAQIEQIYSHLEASSIRAVACLYLTNDLTFDPNCSLLLSEYPCCSYQRYASQLLQEL